MSKQVKVSVSRRANKDKGIPAAGPVEVVVEKPESIQEFLSMGLVEDGEGDLVELAWSSHVIARQSNARNKLDDSEEAARSALADYTYSRRRAAAPKKPRTQRMSKAMAKELKYTSAQLAALKEKFGIELDPGEDGA